MRSTPASPEEVSGFVARASIAAEIRDPRPKARRTSAVEQAEGKVADPVLAATVRTLDEEVDVKIITSRAELQAWSDAERAAGRRVGLCRRWARCTRGISPRGDGARARRPGGRLDLREPDAVQRSEGLRRLSAGHGGRSRRLPRGEGRRGLDTAGRGLYPRSPVWVDVEEISEPLCGQNRPGHFRGVTTVVTKLFLAARPHVAVFGEKDWQQLAVIRRTTPALGGIEIVGGETVRERDGLAMSSRNVHLGPVGRSRRSASPRASRSPSS